MKPDFGIDAPGLVRTFFLVGFGGAVCAALALWHFGTAFPWSLIALSLSSLVMFYALGMGSFMIYGSKIMKIKDSERLLDRLLWTGSEMVLDVGCGRGLMLIGAAKRLTSGKAIGVDIWQARDQSANSDAGAVGNARLIGVSDRVEVKTADMRSLPFTDNTFDIVVTSWAVHNLSERKDREQTISEMARVLRPGGQLLLVDIENRVEYMHYIQSIGFENPTLVVSKIRDQILRLVTFGSFRPAAIFAVKRI